MDAQAKKKALFRARLNAQKKEKRIDSPLVRYNESDQPICRVCNVVLKSESIWDAHQASRKHHEAISNLKTKCSNVKPGSSTGPSANSQQAKLESSRQPSKPQASSMLPPNFFDNNEKVKQKSDSVKSGDSNSYEKLGPPARTQAVPSDSEKKMEGLVSGNVPQKKKVLLPKQLSGSQSKAVKGSVPEGFFDNKEDELLAQSREPTKELTETSAPTAGPDANQVKGALPEGFFDDKDADLRARGIKVVKPDIKDEYKEFEKLIEDDLQVVEDRFEEEEFDAAEVIEEEEMLEQKSIKEKVELLKKKRMEMETARLAKRSKGSEVTQKKCKVVESSSDDDSDEDFAVDWRAQHL